MSTGMEAVEEAACGGAEVAAEEVDTPFVLSSWALLLRRLVAAAAIVLYAVLSAKK